MLENEYRQYKLARETIENDEPDDSTLDDIRVVHAALHPGQEVDWVEVVNRDAPLLGEGHKATDTPTPA